MSDAIFGSGYSIPGFLDSDILYDDLGLPYIHGKTFKGKMGEMAYILIDMLERAEDSRGLADIMKVKRDKLFGVEGQVNANALKFSSCEVSRNLREYIRFYINDAGISPLEILDALTHVETHTAIEKRQE